MQDTTQIEGILFYKAEPVSKKELSTILAVPLSEVEKALEELKTQLESRGVVLVETHDTVSLATAPNLDPLIEKLRKDELKRDIGKAGAETLAIILYREPISRSGIDYIRGVNSTFILRNLLMRGLIQRIPNPKDQRTFQYKITPECLKYLGIQRKQELPEYEAILAEIERHEKESEVE